MSLSRTRPRHGRSGRASRPRSRRRRRLRAAAIAFGVVVALVGTVVGGSAILLHDLVGGNLTTLPASQAFPDEAGRPAASHGAKNILLLGSDSRQKTGEHDLETAGSQRADTMMLVHVSADRKHVSVMSILRDLYVPVPGHSDAKINASLAWGGTRLAVETLEDLLGARIDHVAIIDFAGLADMTRSLGGVWVDNPQAFTAARGGDRFYPAGPIQLEGDRALVFARERYAFATGDYQRVANQQLLLKGILGRLLGRDILAAARCCRRASYGSCAFRSTSSR
jgi:LCP family protein required for cell wall assembly